MIEMTLGAIAAALIAKALDRAEGKAVDQGESALRRLVEFVRGRLSSASDDDGGARELERVEDAPDGKSRIEALALLLDQRAKDPEFGRELGLLVKDAESAGVDIQSTVQVAYGQSPQFANVSDSEINISYGGAAERPRRISD